MKQREHLVSARRRVDLFVREFEPTAADARAGDPPTVVLIHGATEHGGRHVHVAERLCASGRRVLVPDMRGHGRSGGRATHVGRFGEYVDDLARLLDRHGLAPERTALLGHSMGGLVSVRFAQAHPGRVAAVALTSPLLGLSVRLPRPLLASGRILSVAAPWTRFKSKIDPATVTRSAVSIARRAVDPLHHKSVTAGWFFAVQRAVREAWRDAAAFNAPALIVQSGDDRVVDAEASRNWLARCGSPDALFRLLPGQFHELFYEQDWTTTVDLIDAWIAARTGGHCSSGLSRAA